MKKVKTSKPFEGSPFAAYFRKRDSVASVDSNTQLQEEQVLTTFKDKLQLVTPKKAREEDVIKDDRFEVDYDNIEHND